VTHSRIESRRDSFGGIDSGLLLYSAFDLEVCQLYNFVAHYNFLMIKTPLAQLPVCERKLAKLVL
jgi:hypothetical protein